MRTVDFRVRTVNFLHLGLWFYGANPDGAEP